MEHYLCCFEQEFFSEHSPKSPSSILPAASLSITLSPPVLASTNVIILLDTLFFFFFKGEEEPTQKQESKHKQIKGRGISAEGEAIYEYFISCQFTQR